MEVGTKSKSVPCFCTKLLEEFLKKLKEVWSVYFTYKAVDSDLFCQRSAANTLVVICGS